MMVTSSRERSVVSLRDIVHHYQQGTSVVKALSGVSADFRAGELVALAGPSGSGKSTLLNIIALCDIPLSGTLQFEGELIHYPAIAKRRRLRLTSIGYVFQSFNLLPGLTALENVMLPLILQGEEQNEARERASALLSKVALSHRQAHYPHQLSGGEMQRVAVARALSSRPRLIVADEPTGNLDSEHGQAVIELLATAAGEGVAVVMATHSLAARSHATRVIELCDGRVSNS